LYSFPVRLILTLLFDHLFLFGSCGSQRKVLYFLSLFLLFKFVNCYSCAAFSSDDHDHKCKAFRIVGCRYCSSVFPVPPQLALLTIECDVIVFNFYLKKKKIIVIIE
jgi:hypothetical protein